MCQLIVEIVMKVVAHSSCVGITKEPPITPSIQAGAGARITEVTVPSTLGHNVVFTGADGTAETPTQILPAFQLSGTVKLTLV